MYYISITFMFCSFFIFEFYILLWSLRGSLMNSYTGRNEVPSSDGCVTDSAIDSLSAVSCDRAWQCVWQSVTDRNVKQCVTKSVTFSIVMGGWMCGWVGYDIWPLQFSLLTSMMTSNMSLLQNNALNLHTPIW